MDFEQKYNRYRASMAKANKKYYEKSCKIREDMTPEEKAKAQAAIQKRRDNSKKHYKKLKDTIENLVAQLT
jgi:hypothetical protein